MTHLTDKELEQIQEKLPELQTAITNTKNLLDRIDSNVSKQLAEKDPLYKAADTALLDMMAISMLLNKACTEYKEYGKISNVPYVWFMESIKLDPSPVKHIHNFEQTLRALKNSSIMPKEGTSVETDIIAPLNKFLSSLPEEASKVFFQEMLRVSLNPPDLLSNAGGQPVFIEKTKALA